MKHITYFLLVVVLLFTTHLSFGESQGGDYKGVTDPFGDPANYEFSEDEKDDKEFFHLGRYIMLGIDLGVGFFTGGLGTTNTSGLSVGAHLVYFFDKNLALEAAFRYSNHTDTIKSASTGISAVIDTTMTPMTAGFRYYFETKNAPRAIAVANPYLAMTGGLYTRNQTVLVDNGLGLANQGSVNAFGIGFGGGLEFNIYKKHIYLGGDLRYHFVFFPDEDETYSNQFQPGDRGGDFFTGLITLTYNY